MGSKPRAHNGSRVQEFLSGYLRSGELCEEHSAVDDVISGVLELKTAGDTSTRSLSRQTLFHILQQCPSIDVASINRATNGRYAYCTVASYAATARVASKALASFLDRLPHTGTPRVTIRQERQALDAPFDSELQALGLT